MRLSLLQQTCVEDFGGRTVLPPGQLKSSSLLPFICLITKPLSSEIISQETPVSKIIDKGQAAGELRVQDPPFGSPRPPLPEGSPKNAQSLTQLRGKPPRVQLVQPPPSTDGETGAPMPGLAGTEGSPPSALYHSAHPELHGGGRRSTHH